MERISGSPLAGRIHEEGTGVTPLPEPRGKSDRSVEECLSARRSIREYKEAPLTLAEVGQLLWAAQGLTGSDGYRTAPSAGALFPLEVYLVAGRVEALAAGIYKYRPERHELILLAVGDRHQALARAALEQNCVRHGAATLVFSAVYERTTGKYGQRGIRYVHMEAGHAAQNVCLEATALGLGTVPVGAFDDASVKRIVKMPDQETPLYLLLIGRKPN
jgi:SagB-type dehydrogenase family enzyme